MRILSNEDYETEVELEDALIVDGPNLQEDLAISFNAYTGQSTSRTHRLNDHLGGTPIQVLIDSGSTNNFIQSKWRRYISQPGLPTPEFDVMVRNGEKLLCVGKFEQLPVVIQGNKFNIDCYLLPIKGADLVLRVQWLAKLGPCTTDYKNMTMVFEVGGQHIQFKGNTDTVCQPTSILQLQKLEKQYAIASKWLAIAAAAPSQPPI